MNYKDAFAIGSSVEGYIKCHYAELFSPTLGKLFSLQDNNFTSKNEAAKAVGAAYDQNPDVDEHLIIQYDIPVVETTEFDNYDEDKQFIDVPVQLTSYAKQQIIKLLSNHTRPQYTVYWSRVRSGVVQEITRKEILKTYSREQAYSYVSSNLNHYDVVETLEIKPQYQELIEGIKNDGVFYVKPVAIDWIPTDIQNTQLAQDLTEAKQKLETAKALLVTAGAATILL